MTLPGEQRKQIEKEAEKLYPYIWPKNKEGDDFTPRPGQGAPFSKKVKKLQDAYIKGAESRATLCQQKDEEIQRLKEIIIFYDHPDADVEFAARQWATVHEKDEELSRLRMQSLNMKIALQQIEKYECGSDAGNFRIISIKSIATEALKPIIP